MRLINADALSIAVMDAFSIGDVDEDVIWGLVQDAPTIQQPGWISCAERLPEYDREVLVYDRGMIRVYCLHRSKYLRNDVWEDEQGSYQAFEDVTHWMPLPQPPKEGNDEGLFQQDFPE